MIRSGVTSIRTSFALSFLVLTLSGVLLILASRYLGDLFQSILSSLGVAVLATSALSIVVERLQRHTTEQLIENIEGYKSISLSGIEKVYENPSRFLANYASIIDQTKYRVDILIVPSIPLLWMPDFESITIKALGRGTRFRVLTPAPDSGWVSCLSREEGKAYANEAGHLLERWREVEIKAQAFRSRVQLEVRTYDDSPRAFIMITDDLLSFAPYFHSQMSISSPCIQVSARADLIYQPYKRYFESVWMESLEAVELYDQKK